MKILKSLLILFVSVMIITACSKQAEVKDSQGRSIHLNDYQGKWVIINYWATWCKPCLDEMPTLNALYNENRKNLVVLGVSYDKLSNDRIKNVINKFNIKYPMLSSFPMHIFGVDHLDVLPISFVIDPDGKLVKTLKGPQTKEQFSKAVHLS